MTQPQQTTDILRSIIQFSQTAPVLVLLLVLFGAFFLFCILFDLTQFFSAFFHELCVLNMEIARSRDEEERRYYRYLRRRLFLSLLPFFRY